MDKLLIIDGNSVLHRAYYALPDWRNRSGEATAGVYGFLSMLVKAVEELKPSHLIVVFDHPSPTFRHTMYVGYQSNREKDRQISDDIWGQVEKLQLVLSKMQVPVFQMSGFEADDIIGTISQKAKDFSQVIIVTGDRDMMQLVDKKINLDMPLKGITDAVLVDAVKVKERMGVDPKQIIDYKSLVGDSSDNYPGVAGIGPKTAIQLLGEFESFEKIYASLNTSPYPSPNLGEGIKGRGISVGVKQKLINGYEGGVLSKQLATIKTDVPLSVDWNKASVPNSETMAAVFKELGHKSLIKRVGGKEDEDRSRPRLFE